MGRQPRVNPMIKYMKIFFGFFCLLSICSCWVPVKVTEPEEPKVDPSGYCTPEIISVPESFTPNGDGADDILFVSGNGITEVTAFNIYNRWGQLLFTSSTKHWDGKVNGSFVESGVYAYSVEAICSGKYKLKKTGNVSVMR